MGATMVFEAEEEFFNTTVVKNFLGALGGKLDEQLNAARFTAELENPDACGELCVLSSY